MALSPKLDCDDVLQMLVEGVSGRAKPLVMHHSEQIPELKRIKAVDEAKPEYVGVQQTSSPECQQLVQDVPVRAQG